MNKKIIMRKQLEALGPVPGMQQFFQILAGASATGSPSQLMSNE